jgi:hypothetical protein
MVPLQDLVEQNPIEEAAEGKAKHIAGPWMVASGYGIGHGSPEVREQFKPFNRRSSSEVSKVNIY